MLFWPIDAAADVLHAWQQWVTTVPDEVTSVGRLLRFPPLPDHLRGRSFAVVEAACLSYDEPAAAELLAPLRALRPEMDTFGPTPMTELGALHRDPDGPMLAFGDGMLVGALPPAGIVAFVAAVGAGSDSPLLSVELRQLDGGRSEFGRRAARRDGAVEHRGVVPELRRTPQGRARAVRRGHLPAVMRGQGGLRSGRSDPGQPSRPTGPVNARISSPCLTLSGR